MSLFGDLLYNTTDRLILIIIAHVIAHHELVSCATAAILKNIGTCFLSIYEKKILFCVSLCFKYGDVSDGTRSP